MWINVQTWVIYAVHRSSNWHKELNFLLLFSWLLLLQWLIFKKNTILDLTKDYNFDTSWKRLFGDEKFADGTLIILILVWQYLIWTGSPTLFTSHKWFIIRPKKKTSLFPVAGLKIAMRNAVFIFFFTIHEKAMRNAVFIFFKQNFRKKIRQNNSLGFFSTFIKNITSFISKWFMWPFILHALGASLMNFLPWPKLHHIWKKIQSKCTECM